MRWVVYVDMDAFYVACELKERPDLRGRAVIVGRPPGDTPHRGVVLSASYEARAKGVHSAQPVAAAARLCPEAVWIPPDFDRYRRASEAVRAVLRRRSETVIPHSIDEASFRVELPDADSARELATQVQADLVRELELPSSIGVASHRSIAKIATDRAKPGGVVVVPPDRAAEFLAGLPVRAISGVGPKTDDALRAAGIATIGDLATRPRADVARVVGGMSDELIQLARGQPREESEEDGEPRLRSTDFTFDEDVGEWPDLEERLRAMATDLAAALREERLAYRAVGVAFRWSDFSRTQRSRSLTGVQEGTEPLVLYALRLGRGLWDSERAGRGRRVRTVSVRTERLVSRPAEQRPLEAFEGVPGPGSSPGERTRYHGTRSPRPSRRVDDEESEGR